MIYKNTLLHNISELKEQSDGGYLICRVPLAVEKSLNDVAKTVNHYATGTEMRFVMLSDSVTITLSKPRLLESDRQCAARADVYFGNIPCGYTDCEITYKLDKTEVTINRQSEVNREDMMRVSEMANYGFSPEVVRIIFPSKALEIYDVSGDMRIPHADEMPKEHCIFYGSSITNGSLALKTPDAFAFRIAEKFGLDYYNLGYSGSAHCEKEMAEYIADLPKKGLKFINLEMGGNMYGFPTDEYKSQVKTFVEIIAKAHKDIPVICTDLFYCREDFRNEGNDTKTAEMRNALRTALDELNLPNTHYIIGTKLLTGVCGLSGDFVHPNIHGITEIYENLSSFIKQYI